MPNSTWWLGFIAGWVLSVAIRRATDKNLVQWVVVWFTKDGGKR